MELTRRHPLLDLPSPIRTERRICTIDCIDFIRAEIKTVSLAGIRVLEVGAYDVNGSVRDLVRGGAATYVGVDIVPGPGVDVVAMSKISRRVSARIPLMLW